MTATYRYGFDVHGEIQDVATLHKYKISNLEPFSCVGCGAPLTAKLGPKNIKHFAHASGDGCGKETYLHILGKRIFIETYLNCLKPDKSFIVALDTSIECTQFEESLGHPCRSREIHEFDLTDYFGNVTEEAWHDGYRPDVLLTTDKTTEAIYIEIAVHHKSSDDKINSGRKIIEYSIESEDDISILKNTRLDAETANVELFNFNPKPIRGNICNGKCKCYSDYFTVDRNGRAAILNATSDIIDRDIKNQRIWFYSICQDEENKRAEFRKFLKDAINKGAKIRNCLVCMHYELTEFTNFLVCRKHKKKVSSAEAFRCSCFTIDRS
ncbi:MAG: hypothetical protein PHI97_28820 [Desulfobulbus sp.]|nr:hypothetical protein [Desulfobulbus sp.]